MNGWDTTVESSTGTYYSPPEDDEATFLRLIQRLLNEQEGEERSIKITHQKRGEEPIVRVVRVTKLA